MVAVFIAGVLGVVVAASLLHFLSETLCEKETKDDQR